LISTFLFNRHVNKLLEDLLTNVEFKRFTEKLSRIFEGKNSLVDDIRIAENWQMIVLGVLSGFFLFLVLASASLMILHNLNIGKDLAAIIVVFVVIYLYQDIIKTGYLVEYKTKETKFPFVRDVIEMYTVDNSLASVSKRRSSLRMVLRFLSGIVGPLCHLTLPKLSCEMLIVYNNPELVKSLREFTDRTDQICFKHEEGQSVNNFFTEGQSEKMTVLNERSPIENFPYLFNPNYSYSEKEKKKWVALSILEKNPKSEKTVGHIFIHSFRGLFVKRRVRRSDRRKLKEEIKPKEVLLFILFGERSYIQFIKTRIEVISTRFPLSILNIEQ